VTTDMDIGLLHAAAACYLAATVAARAGLVVAQELPGRMLRWLLGGGLVLHLTSIVMRASLVGALPVASFGETLSLLAALLVASFLVIQVRGPLLALSAVVVPIAFGLTLAAAVVKGGAQPLPEALRSVWLPIHVLLSFLGEAVFALAASASVLYLVQERRLKQHRGRLIRGLPSLETLDRVSHTCLKWGLVLLTLGIVSGIVWAHEAWTHDAAWMSDPKLLFTALVWALYVVLLQGRITAGWRGRWAAQLTLAGFAVIVVSLLSVNLFGLGLHGAY
jgi:cytochrome c-type biogenesis protein CcsB